MKQIYITTIEARENKMGYESLDKALSPSVRGEPANVFSYGLSYCVTDVAKELFRNVISAFEEISHEIVKKQVAEALNYFSKYISLANTSSLRLQKLTAAQNEDSSFLIEWHYNRFHIGLSFEPIENESYYFLVSVDESIGEVDTRTRRINGELDIIVSDIVQFVIKNI